jgi:hypothetical protein
LKSFLSGAENAFELSFTWFIVYVLLLIIRDGILLWATPPNLRWTTPWLLGTLGYVSVLGLFYGRWLDASLKPRYLRRALMLMIALLVLLFLSLPHLLNNPPQTGGELLPIVMRAGTVAWLLATAIIVLLATIPGAAFNRDFADLQMFPMINYLRFASGFILFWVAARQMLEWPDFDRLITQPLTGIYSGLVGRNPEPLTIWERLLRFMEPAVVFAVVAFALVVLYVHLSIKTTRRRNLLIFYDAIRLMLHQIIDRIMQRKKVLWPRPRIKLPRNVHEDTQLIEYSLTTTYPAVTLLFALTLPALTGATIPGGQRTIDWYGVVFLVVFVVGNVDIWLQTLELVSERGISYTIGAWTATLLLYWPTTLLIVLFMEDILLISGEVTAVTMTAQTAFAATYRFLVAALTILLAFSQMEGVRVVGPARVFRRGIATTSLLLVIGFGLNTVNLATPGLYDSRAWQVVLSAVLLALFLLLQRPRLEARLALRRPQSAQLLIAPSIAVAPLLINRFVRSIQPRSNGTFDLVTGVSGIADDELDLRIHVVGSEQEVAWEANSLNRRLQRGQIDFIITDLLTAIDIIGEREKGPNRYRIGAILGDFSWTRLRIAPESKADQLILDAGFLLYPSSPRRQPGSVAPCGEGGADCRQSSFAVISRYAYEQYQKISFVYCPQPYRAWLQRKLAATPAAHVERYQPTDRVIYVLLARANDRRGRPTIAFPWRRTIAAMILDGQKTARMDQDRLHDDHLARLRDFFLHATNAQLDFSFADIHLALCQSRFVASFPGNTGKSNDHTYLAARDKLFAHNLLTYADWDRMVCDSAQTEADIRSQSTGEPMDWRAFERWADRGLRERLTNPVSGTTFIRELFEKTGILDTTLFDSLVARQAADTEDLSYFLFPILRIPIGNYPGEIARIMRPPRLQEFNFVFLSSTNLGDSAFIYLLRDSLLPPRPEAAIRKGHIDWERPLRWEDNLSTIDEYYYNTVVDELSEMGIDLQQLYAFAVPIRNRPGTLLALLDRLKESAPGENQTAINLEQLFVFTLTANIALALLVPAESDRVSLFHRLTDQAHNTPQQATPIPTDSIPATRVELEPGFPRHRHRQQAIFDFPGGVPEGYRFKFSISDKSVITFSLLWGGIDQWLPEVDLTEVRLKVPTEWLWWVNLSDRLGLHRLQADKKPLGDKARDAGLWHMHLIPVEADDQSANDPVVANASHRPA